MEWKIDLWNGRMGITEQCDAIKYELLCAMKIIRKNHLCYTVAYVQI